MSMYWAPLNTWEYTTYAMMAWYSRDKSSLRSSARRSREISSARSWDVFSLRVRLVAQQLGNLRRRAYSEPEPHPGGAVPGHAADDQVLPRWLRGEAHVVCCFRRKPLRKL